MKKVCLCFAFIFALWLVSQPITHASFATPTASSFTATISNVSASAIQLNGNDTDGTPLVFSIVSSPGAGTLSNLDTSTGAVVYTPSSNTYTGTTTFAYKVTSGGQDSNTATVTVVITNQRTRVLEPLTYPDGTPMRGTVTFVMSRVDSVSPVGPSGLIPVGASVTAVLNSSGILDTSLVSTRSLFPVSYYQAWFQDAQPNLRPVELGIYDIPASNVSVTLSSCKVTDTAKAKRHLFASYAQVEALINALAAGAASYGAHPIVGAGHNDTVNTGISTGALLMRNASSQWQGLAPASGVLKSTGGVPFYGTIDSADIPTILANKTITGGTISGATINSFLVRNIADTASYSFQPPRTAPSVPSCLQMMPSGEIVATGEPCGASAVLPSAMPTTGALGIWYAKDYDSVKKAIPNALAGSIPNVITRNWRGVFDTGKVGGASGAGGWLGGGFDGMTVTEKYAAGLDGVQAATRIVFASTSNGLRYRQTISLPAGTYTMAIHAKSNTGSNQDFLMSRDGGTTTATKTATTTMQLFTNEFTLSSTTTVDLRFMKPTASGSGDFVIDKAFLWEGNAASVPADLIDAGHMYLGNTRQDTINCTGGELYLSTGEVGSIDLPAFSTTAGTTILAVVKRVTNYTGTTSTRQPFIWNVVEATTSGGVESWSLGEYEGEGQLKGSFGNRQLFPASGGFSPNLFVDAGYHVISMAADTSTIDLWFDDMGLAGSYSSGGTRTARKFQVGNSNSFGLTFFKLNALAIYERKLTEEERRIAVAALIANAAASSITITKPTNMVVAGYDSITAGPSNNSYAQAYLANTTKPRSVFVQESIGGSTLHLNPTANLNLDTRMNAYGLSFVPAKSSDRTGRKFIIALLPGANDLQPNYTGDVTAFLNALWAVTDPLRARGYTVGIATILPKGSAISGYATHNTARATANTQIRALVGVKFDFLIDFAADATMGPDAAANNTALYGDGLHPTASAHSTYLEPIYRAAINGRLN